MRNGIYNASIVTVAPDLAPADPAIEDVAAPAALPADWEPGYQEWVDDCERNAAAEHE